MPRQRAGGCLGERTAGADGRDAVIRLDDVPAAAEDVGVVHVGDQQEGFEVAQGLVGSPVLGQFHHRAGQVAVVLFELGFEAAEQGEGALAFILAFLFRSFLAEAFRTSWPSVTWPSPAMTTLPFLRTQRTVVDRIRVFMGTYSL